MFIALLNFIILNISGILLVYFSKIGAMPASREEKRGEKAWEECARYRSLVGVFELIMVTNMLLWIWFPIPNMKGVVYNNFLVSIVIGLSIAIPSLCLLLKGLKDAGKESLHPSKDTIMFGGIYQYIRHPQNFGELSLFIALAFAINSLFLVLWSIISVIIYLPIIIYFEEKDLVKRFGKAYIEYRHYTGILIPKFWRRGRKQKKVS